MTASATNPSFGFHTKANAFIDMTSSAIFTFQWQALQGN